MRYLIGAALVTLIALIISQIWKIFMIVLWRPYALTRNLRKQGITGPPYSLVAGSLPEIRRMLKDVKGKVMDTQSHDIAPRVPPHYHTWSSLYGEAFLYWYGTKPRVCISDPELAKQILSNKFGFYRKPEIRPSIKTLIGKGLVLTDGLEWVKHCRILNPAFSMDKLKNGSVYISMLDEWEKQASEAKDSSTMIQMDEEFQELTADIIAHAFGSSFVRGKEAFNAQKELQKHCAAFSADIFIPSSPYLPTPSNLKTWKLDRKIKNPLKQIIETRLHSQSTRDKSDWSYGDDLLCVMIESAKASTGPKLNMKEILDECKTFFFAGHETTSNLLTWTVFLLSVHSEWQEKLREEVLQNCGMEIPDADMLSKLKLLNMVLMEALRLYCPAILLVRETSQDMKLGNLFIPSNTGITILIARIHRSKEYWGEDANTFNPLRFIDGVSRAAKHPNAACLFDWSESMRRSEFCYAGSKDSDDFDSSKVLLVAFL